VKNYHHKFYCPENLYLIITGVVEPEQVLATVSAFEKKITGKVCYDMCRYFIAASDSSVLVVRPLCSL